MMVIGEKMRVIGVIPSRIGSTRLERKPLIEIHGIPMIIHVYKRAAMSDALDELYVATDSDEIRELVEFHGGNVIMTSESHNNGTERVAEVATKVEGDVFVCIFGDEPMLDPEHIGISVSTLTRSGSDASILGVEFQKLDSYSDVKMVLNDKSEVMYLSRQDIPFNKSGTSSGMIKAYHLLSFTIKCLSEFARLGKSKLEIIEDIEHLRLLENGFRISSSIVESDSISLDTEDDLDYINMRMEDDLIRLKYSNN